LVHIWERATLLVY